MGLAAEPCPLGLAQSSNFHAELQSTVKKRNESTIRSCNKHIIGWNALEEQNLPVQSILRLKSPILLCKSTGYKFFLKVQIMQNFSFWGIAPGAPLQVCAWAAVCNPQLWYSRTKMHWSWSETDIFRRVIFNLAHEKLVEKEKGICYDYENLNSRP